MHKPHMRAHAGTGDEELDEALSVLSEGDYGNATATEQSDALAVLTQRITQLFADFDVTLGALGSGSGPILVLALVLGGVDTRAEAAPHAQLLSVELSVLG